MTKARSVIYAIFSVFVIMVTVFAVAITLAMGMGAIGFPGNNPLWLLLTAPWSLLVASAEVVGGYWLSTRLMDAA
jgi:hypothetical protein